MPGPGVLLPLAVFFIMGIAVILLLWGIVVVGGKLLRDDQFRRTAGEIARAADAALAELADVVDQVRRRRTPPEAAQVPLQVASQAISRYRVEAAALARNTNLAALAANLEVEIERAERAMDLIGHGVEMLTETSRGRLGEGETAIKRGYVNLLHAREGIETRGQEIAASDESRGRGLRRRLP